MIQLIAFIIFLASILGILFILGKKVPVLVKLPQNGYHGFKKIAVILAIEKRLKDFHFDFFHKQVFLHKLLSQIKILVLKIETKLDALLHGIRKKAQQLEKEGKRKR